MTAYDYVPTASTRRAAVARRAGLDLAVRRLNLLELRSALAEGARLAHQPGPRTVVARHLADATTRFGRDSLWRFASMALRDGGRLYAEYWVEGGDERAVLRRLRSRRRCGAELDGARRRYRAPRGDLRARRGESPGAGSAGLVAQWRT